MPFESLGPIPVQCFELQTRIFTCNRPRADVTLKIIWKEVSITVLRIPQQVERFLKDPDVWKTNKWERFEDNEATKVLKCDCVGRKRWEWLIFICPNNA